MIYKIIGHFNNENFDKIITKVSSRFKFIYCNDALYVAMKRIDNVDDDRNYLYKIFKPARDFYID